jgi:hypothetical protein
LNKKWKQDIEAKRNLARTYLITGEDQISEPDDVMDTQAVNIVESATQPKGQINAIPLVTATTMVTFPMQLDIANEFTLNDQQKSAFMIITGHLNGDSRFHAGISCSFVHMIFNYVCHR